MNRLDKADRKIINLIQSDFPITSRPYAAIAEKAELSEDAVIERLKKLRQTGLIRRIGGNFVPHKIGYVSTLCAACVPKDKLEVFTKTVNRYPGVTHNYLRENEFNIWFTFIAPSYEAIDQHLSEISSKTGVSPILNLPATKVFKIKAEFKV